MLFRMATLDAIKHDVDEFTLLATRPQPFQLDVRGVRRPTAVAGDPGMLARYRTWPVAFAYDVALVPLFTGFRRPR